MMMEFQRGLRGQWGDLKNGRYDLGAVIQVPGFWLTSWLPWISHGCLFLDYFNDGNITKSKEIQATGIFLSLLEN